MKYFKKVKGERLYLSPMNPEDFLQYTKWFNDRDVVENLGNYAHNFSIGVEKKALEELADNGHNYAIVLNDGDELIGNISLMSISPVYRSAELGIFIGEKEKRGNGYGTEAIKLLVDYGFNTLNLKNIMLTLDSENTGGYKCYLKSGFTEFGRRHRVQVYKRKLPRYNLYGDNKRKLIYFPKKHEKSPLIDERACFFALKISFCRDAFYVESIWAGRIRLRPHRRGLFPMSYILVSIMSR